MWIKIVHNRLNLWINNHESLKYKASFAMMILLLNVNMLFYPPYYQHPVDKVVNKFNLSIFLFLCGFGILGIYSTFFIWFRHIAVPFWPAGSRERIVPHIPSWEISPFFCWSAAEFPLAIFQGHFVLRSLTTLPHDLGGGMSFYGLQQHFWDFRRFAEAPRAALCSLIR